MERLLYGQIFMKIKTARDFIHKIPLLFLEKPIDKCSFLCYAMGTERTSGDRSLQGVPFMGLPKTLVWTVL